MVEYLEQDQIQSFKEAFDSFDTNDNGKVSSQYLQVCLTMLNNFGMLKILIFAGADEASRSKPDRCRDPGYCQQSRRRFRFYHVFGSDRSSRNAIFCPSEPILSRAYNLHLLASDF